MVKKYLALAMVLLLLGAAISCGGGDISPSGVAQAFYEAINGGDFEKAEEYLAVRESLKDTSLGYLVGKIERVEIADEEIMEGGWSTDTAWVHLRVTLRLGAEEQDAFWAVAEKGHKRIYLAKREGEWKIIKRL